jgi:hypothetical protein
MCFYHLGFFLELDSSEIRGLYRLDGMLTVQPVQFNVEPLWAGFSPHTTFFCMIASRAGIK